MGLHSGGSMTIRPAVLAAVTAALVSVALMPGTAQQSPPTSGAPNPILDGLSWRSIGPDRGGRSIAVSGVKGRPREAYFGAVGGGLWKTVDAGENWLPVTDGQIKSASVGALAVAESNPDVVFIGMGEACIRGNIMPGDGVYKSADAGKTWTHVGFGDSQAISKIRIHPSNPDIRSENWLPVTDGQIKSASVGALAVAESNPDVVFIGMGEACIRGNIMPGDGVYKSSDAGKTWTHVGFGDSQAISKIRIHPSNPDI